MARERLYREMPPRDPAFARHIDELDPELARDIDELDPPLAQSHDVGSGSLFAEDEPGSLIDDEAAADRARPGSSPVASARLSQEMPPLDPELARDIDEVDPEPALYIDELDPVLSQPDDAASGLPPQEGESGSVDDEAAPDQPAPIFLFVNGAAGGVYRAASGVCHAAAGVCRAAVGRGVRRAGDYTRASLSSLRERAGRWARAKANVTHGRVTSERQSEETPSYVAVDVAAENRHSESEPVTLANLVDRQVAIEYHEAVAIVQQLGDALRRLGRPAPAVDDLSLVQITAEGDVQVSTGRRTTDRPSDDLISILRTLLPTDHPVPLRLLADIPPSDATNARSIEQLSESLAYFERPGRAEVIRDVYQRYFATPREHSTREVREQKAKSRRPVWDRRKTRAAMAAAGVVLVGLGLTLGLRQVRNWGWGESTLSTITQDARMLVGEIGEDLRGVSSTALEEIRQRVGLDEPDVDLSLSSRAGEPTPSVREAVRALVPAAAAVLADTEIAAVVESVVESVEEEERPSSEIELTIFTSHDADVTPPVAVRPLIGTIPEYLMAGDDVIAVVEAVVSTAGTVESVKLLARRTVHNAMILSAVKTWEFHPATNKDGQAVRFRHFISIP